MDFVKWSSFSLPTHSSSTLTLPLCMGQWLNPVTVMMQQQQQQQLRTQFVESPPAWLVVAHCRT